MKKVTLNGEEEIVFLVRGVRHDRNAVEVTINKKGVVVSDEDAEIINSRLGGNVTIVDVESKDVEKEAKKALKEAEEAEKKAAAEAKKAEEKAKKEAEAKAKKEAEAKKK